MEATKMRTLDSIPRMTAHGIGEQALKTITHRAAERDTEEGERSMAATVNAFNALTGAALTETEGWIFMVLLKLARSRAGSHQLDDYIDGAAYMMLAGECADKWEG